MIEIVVTFYRLYDQPKLNEISSAFNALGKLLCKVMMHIDVFREENSKNESPFLKANNPKFTGKMFSECMSIFVKN